MAGESGGRGGFGRGRGGGGGRGAPGGRGGRGGGARGGTYLISFPFLSPSIHLYTPHASDKLTFDSFFDFFQGFQVEDAVALVVDLAEAGAVPPVVGEPAVVVAEAVVVVVVAVVERKGGATPSWSRIDTLGCSSPRGRTICWSRRIWCRGRVCMGRRGYRLMVVWRGRRRSIGFGIRLGASWRRGCWVGWMIFLSSLVRRFCTLVLPVGRV